MISRLHRILSAAALVPVLMFAFSGTSSAAWRCQYDGIARPECCCPKKVRSTDATSAMSAGDCCDVEKSSFAKAPTDLPRNQATAIVSPALLSTPVAVLVQDPLRGLRAFRHVPQERPPGGPALLLQKRSFLI